MYLMFGGISVKNIELSHRDLSKIPLLQISRNIVNTEARLYLYDHKDKWNHLKEVLKIYYNTEEEFLVNKVFVISWILANKKYLDINELVLPTSLVSVDNKISGFSMPFVEDNVNLTFFLNNPNVSLEQKMKYLKGIYDVLEKLLSIKELEGKFYLGDVHEANFILDLTTQSIKVVDIDSAYVTTSRIPSSKYISFNENISDNDRKYPKDNFGEVIPSKNTVMLSFIYMLMNVLSGIKNSSKWSIHEYYTYLSKLADFKVSKELLDVLASVYDYSDSILFDKSLLDGIDLKKDYSLVRCK